jgi:hypothetical protein
MHCFNTHLLAALAACVQLVVFGLILQACTHLESACLVTLFLKPQTFETQKIKRVFQNEGY